MLGDSTLFRAYLRWLNMLDPADAIFGDEDVVRRARNVQAQCRANPPATALPSREELLRVMQPARV